jgi:hypothetical protein
VRLNKLPIHGKWNPPTWIRPAEKAGAEGSEVNFNDQASKDKWMTAFVEEGGFLYAMQALLNYDMALVGKDGKQRSFDLKDLSFLMTLMKVFLLGAFESKSEMDYKLPLQRKSSNVSVEDETEEKTESQFNARLRTIMQNSGESLINDIDLPSLSNKLLQIISTMLAVQEDKKESLDEKAIVDSALSVWMGCLIFDKSLFESFLSFENFHSEIMNPSDFIMNGILYSPTEKIR